MLSVHPFIFNPVQENTYLIANANQECLIVDPGCYFEDELVKLISFINLKQLQPVGVLLTHAHFDHVFGLAAVCEAWQLMPQMHVLETPVLERAAASAAKYGLEHPGDYKGEFRYIKEGDIITFGGVDFSVLETPGHSPGSVSFHCAAQHFVISGDVLFQGSIGRTDIPGGDLPTLEKSIREKLYQLPPNTMVLSGHGAPTTIAHEMATNPFVKT
jgi:hydroxyacylglutathione hydrolase